METLAEMRLREVETYFAVVSRLTSDRGVSARSFQNVARYTEADFEGLSALLKEVGATASFPFLGRDAEEYAGAMATLEQDGHDVVLHGYRHTGCADLSYDKAHQYLSLGLDAIEATAGVTPTGFSAPALELSEGTLRAVAELGLDWAFGTTDEEVPSEISVVSPVMPYDNPLFFEGNSADAVFDQLTQQAESEGAFLVHPNIIEYFDGLEAFRTWIEQLEPQSVDEFIGTGGFALMCDCIRPLRIE